jgi:phytoene/squalene synthetase
MECSKITTNKYSTSFSLGIKFLDKELRGPIYNIYGFVRLADEIVDSFNGFDQASLMSQFEFDLNNALENKISLNPILNSFQSTVHRFNIDRYLIEKFLISMKMDLGKIEYDDEKYKDYILGSAEVVGLMCLKVFVDGDSVQYEKLKPFGMKLGAAFQKVNFLRDIKDDFELLGRTYFPGLEGKEFNSEEKAKIELEIEQDFIQALEGIRLLPSTSGPGVYLAYKYYQKLFKKIKETPANVIMSERIRVPNIKKFFIMFSSMMRYQFNIL